VHTLPPDSKVDKFSSHVFEDIINQTNMHMHDINMVRINLPENISVVINGVHLNINSLKLIKQLIAKNIIDVTLEEALQVEKYIK